MKKMRITNNYNSSKMKYKLLIVILLVGFSSLAQNKLWTLQECVTHALENNITVQKGENSILLNEQDIKGAKRKLFTFSWRKCVSRIKFWTDGIVSW